MKKKSQYTTEVNLYHHEIPAAISMHTGEIRSTQNNKKNNVPAGKEIFQPDSLFVKRYHHSWFFLKRYLTAQEYRVADTLAYLAKANTNSLEPLNDATAVSEIMKILDISINTVTPILKKLFGLGVYGKFEAAKVGAPYTRYWVFNPYLSFMGKIIDSSISELFKGTHCEIAHHNPTHSLTTVQIKELKIKASCLKNI
jgi:hypothetical protein